ncbi:MAG: Asp-tRNA(Asn)/Glu-tRNA(Gln) amidotransferase subunit GatC [Candidatus Eisenbacteria bacterium]
MKIERAEVERIAALAKLELPADRVEETAAQLSRVLDFVAELDRLDLAGCEPSVLAPADVPLRDDVPGTRGLDPDAAVAGAPESEYGFFVVPPVVENVNP